MPETPKVIQITRENTRLGNFLWEAFKEEKIGYWDMIAIWRCVKYSDQIADISLGAMFRPDIKDLLEPRN
jgi:hypothetical protein